MFILRAELVSAQTRSLLQSAARAVIWSRRGSLFQQVKRLEESGAGRRAAAKTPAATERCRAAASPLPKLEFFNGLGGFAAGGREYVTILGEGQWTPAPWINVIANPSFGFQVSVEGGGYTWSINSQQNQLTPVVQRSRSAIGQARCSTFATRTAENSGVRRRCRFAKRPRPTSPGTVRATAASSTLRTESRSSFCNTCRSQDPIKISRLKIRNHSRRSRRLSVTAYVEWVLGTSRAASAPFVVTEIDPETGAMLARNHWSTEFGSRVAFADLAGRQVAWTGDRTEFLGRNGTLDHPAALEGETPLSNRVGAGLDPCGALQTRLELAPNEAAEIVFFLGEAATKAEAVALITRYRTADLDSVCAR